MRRKLEQFTRWALDVEWAMVATVASSFIMLTPELLGELDIELQNTAAQGVAENSFRSIVVLVAGVLIRSKVWSKATVIEIAGDDHAEAHVEAPALAGIDQSEQYLGVHAGDKEAIKTVIGV